MPILAPFHLVFTPRMPYDYYISGTSAGKLQRTPHMNTETKPKITKDTVPEDFTLLLALTDSLPVIFFGASMLLIGRRFSSLLFIAGALLCLIGGAGKVLWKIIVVLRKKNVWPLFIQMRILMPAGFLLMPASLFTNADKLSFLSICQAVTSFPSVIFFAAGLLGMVLMTVFAFVLDSADPRANWIEQLTNGVSQAAFFIGLFLLK
jgi:hypothetical protein